MARNNGKNRLPVVFIGHGNPMNALWTNPFTQALGKLGGEIPAPKAVLCISAHWMSEGTWITHMARPKTIHDFYGFPQELFDIRYPAPGHPELAETIQSAIQKPRITLDDEMWGFDHGAWAILRHIYPDARIPVIQLSLNMSQPPEFHFELGRKLRAFREQGVLILGSGNIVHNLRRIRWEDDAKPYDWAVEFDEWVKKKLEERNDPDLLKAATSSEAGKLSIPTLDHWLPLLYILGASAPEDRLHFLYEGIDNGSISMRCFALG